MNNVAQLRYVGVCGHRLEQALFLTAASAPCVEHGYDQRHCEKKPIC